jgi:hypothetical protein
MAMPPTRPNNAAATAVSGPATGTGITEVATMFTIEYSRRMAGDDGSNEIPSTVVRSVELVTFSIFYDPLVFTRGILFD